MSQTTGHDLSYRVESPVTGEVVERFATASDADVETALTDADRAFKSWRLESIERRGAVVNRVAELFTERKQRLANIISDEMGKPISEGIEEAEFCTEIFNYFADKGPALAADQPIETFARGSACIQRRPIGALLGIMPWNFPYYQVARFAAPNLVLGNTIVLKHAEICPRSANAIQTLMDDAGIPTGAYINLFASHDQIANMIADPRIQGISLTGSERAGSAIGALAGQHLKKAVLELGGSDPYIVLDTADVKESARIAWQTRLFNTGQACNSNKRLIAMDNIYDDFVEELTKQAAQLKPGKPADESGDRYTPMSSRSAAETLDNQIKAAVSAGATLHTGGRLHDDQSAYFSPGVLTGVTSDMAAYREELFGPVAVVYRASSDSEALALANDSPYGLGGAVFSTDPNRAATVAQQLDVGMSNINTPAGEGAELPFGGVKRSGFGRELGPLGMEEFVNKRMYFVAK
jgi:succinate-semialdehyde dehydrogenase/glutarate-semialdehyde dehydrogenase